MTTFKQQTANLIANNKASTELANRIKASREGKIERGEVVPAWREVKAILSNGVRF